MGWTYLAKVILGSWLLEVRSGNRIEHQRNTMMKIFLWISNLLTYKLMLLIPFQEEVSGKVFFNGLDIWMFQKVLYRH